MQEFDYSNETSNDLYDAVDGLSYEEAVFAKEAIEKIKEEKEEKTTGKISAGSVYRGDVGTGTARIVFDHELYSGVFLFS